MLVCVLCVFSHNTLNNNTLPSMHPADFINLNTSSKLNHGCVSLNKAIFLSYDIQHPMGIQLCFSVGKCGQISVDVITARVKSFVEIHCSSKTGRGEGGGGDCTRNTVDTLCTVFLLSIAIDYNR